MGVERWFERKASDLRGEAKIHLGRSHFAVVAATNRPRVWPRHHRQQRRARELRNGCQGCRWPKKSEEGRSSTFPPQMTFFDEIEAGGAEGILYLTTSM